MTIIENDYACDVMKTSEIYKDIHTSEIYVDISHFYIFLYCDIFRHLNAQVSKIHTHTHIYNILHIISDFLIKERATDKRIKSNNVQGFIVAFIKRAYLESNRLSSREQIFISCALLTLNLTSRVAYVYMILLMQTD